MHSHVSLPVSELWATASMKPFVAHAFERAPNV